MDNRAVINFTFKSYNTELNETCIQILNSYLHGYGYQSEQRLTQHPLSDYRYELKLDANEMDLLLEKIVSSYSILYKEATEKQWNECNFQNELLRITIRLSVNGNLNHAINHVTKYYNL